MAGINRNKSSYLEKETIEYNVNNHIQELTKYDSELNNLFGTIVKIFTKLQLQDHTSNTIESSNKLLNIGGNILNNIKKHVKTIETLMCECSDFTDRITDDLSSEKPNDNFVYHTAHGMLSFPDREFITKTILNYNKKDKAQSTKIKLKKPQDQVSDERKLVSDGRSTAESKLVSDGRSTSESKLVSDGSGTAESRNTNLRTSSFTDLIRINIPNINYYLNVPYVNDVSEIPHSIYYVKNQPGLYIRLPNNNIARIPFPEIVDSKKEYDRKHSIRCKYVTKNECSIQRFKISKMYNSIVRVCNFAHMGDPLIKIGYPSRCPGVPRFGNPESLFNDIKYVEYNDIKNTLMYGLNDLISSIVWLDYTNVQDQIFNDLDIA